MPLVQNLLKYLEHLESSKISRKNVKRKMPKEKCLKKNVY